MQASTERAKLFELFEIVEYVLANSMASKLY